MTAERWWVRLAARWLARIDGVSNQLRLAMLGLTGLSTALLTLQSYGHGGLAWPLISVVLGGTLVYTYLFTEGGVWNQMSRDRSDLSGNYAPPTMFMDDYLIAISVFAAVHQREPTEDEQQMIYETVRAQWQEFREGIDIEAEANGGTGVPADD
jgi:hypothetical protein